MKLSICATSTSTPLIRPARAPHSTARSGIASGQGTSYPDLQADRHDVPQHDAEANGEVDAPGHHRQHRAKRQQRDDAPCRSESSERSAAVGNESGSRMEKKTASSTVRIGRP